MSIAKFLREWTAFVRSEASVPKVDTSQALREQALNKLLAEARANGMSVTDAKITVQEVARYTISQNGEVCLWDTFGNAVAIRVKSKMTSRRNLHKRARSMIGRQFASIDVVPKRPVDVITMTCTFGQVQK